MFFEIYLFIYNLFKNVMFFRKFYFDNLRLSNWKIDLLPIFLLHLKIGKF